MPNIAFDSVKVGPPVRWAEVWLAWYLAAAGNLTDMDDEHMALSALMSVTANLLNTAVLHPEWAVGWMWELDVSLRGKEFYEEQAARVLKLLPLEHRDG